MSELLPSFERNCRQSLVTTESSGPFNLQLLVRFNSKSILILHFYRYWGSCFYIKRVGNCCARGLLLFFIKKLQHHALLLADIASLGHYIFWRFILYIFIFRLWNSLILSLVAWNIHCVFVATTLGFFDRSGSFTHGWIHQSIFIGIFHRGAHGIQSSIPRCE